MYGIIMFKTSLNTDIFIRSVQVFPKNRAVIKLFYVDGFDVEKHNLVMEGDDYLAWGNDDDYIAHFVLKILTGGLAKLVKEDNAIVGSIDTNENTVPLVPVAPAPSGSE